MIFPGYSLCVLAEVSGHKTFDHFAEVGKMVNIGSGGGSLTAENAESTKK